MTKITLTENGMTTRNATPEQAAARGHSADAIAAALRKAQLAPIRDECRRRIYAAASGEAQTNMTMKLGLISAKVDASRTAEEVQMVATFGLALTWVDDMRAQIEIIADDDTLSMTADSSWPELPAAVAALVEQF